MKHFMNTTSIIAVAAVAGFIGFASTGANAATSGAVSADAEIVAPIAVTAGTNSLQFGLVGNTAAHVVTVSTADARSSTVPAQLVAGTTPTAADFNVTGSGAATYTITLPASVSLTGTGPAMTVNNFVHDAGATPTLTAGADAFNVGADLTVPSGQTAGAYTGSFTVTVNY